jgi:hypothetical protein
LIRDRLTYSRRIPWRTSKREIKRGRDITWELRAMPPPEWVMEQWPGSATIIAVRSHGMREGKPQDETRYYVSSLRTGAKGLLRSIRQRWSIENSWHWVRDVPLREDAHRYREFNGVQILATLRSLPSMPCGSMAFGRSLRGSPPWLTTSRGCSGCWAGKSPRRQRDPRGDF